MTKENQGTSLVLNFTTAFITVLMCVRFFDYTVKMNANILSFWDIFLNVLMFTVYACYFIFYCFIDVQDLNVQWQESKVEDIKQWQELKKKEEESNEQEDEVEVVQRWEQDSKFKQQEKIKVMQWNCLSDTCANNSPQGFPYVDPKYLDWDYRKNLIFKHIKQQNPDILCLQEVAKYNFQAFLDNLHGYSSFKHSPLPESEHINVIMFRTASFQSIGNFNLKFSGSNQGAAFSIVKDLKNNKKLLLVNTHLKAKPENEAVRISQVEGLLKYISLTIKKYKIKHIVLCGDMNDTPKSSPIMKMRKSLIWASNPFLFRNSNKDADSEQYTTCKYRQELVKRTIDYIFTKNMITSTRLTWSDNTTPKLGLPSSNWPSDHISVVLTLKYK